MNKATDILQKILPFEKRLLEEYYSDEEYKDLLLTTGISERDYITLQDSLKDFLTRGSKFLKRELASDALDQYKFAQLIAPNSVDVNLGLSKSYLQLWQKSTSSTDKSYAEKYAQICLKFDANSESAADIIKQLRDNNRKKKINKESSFKNLLSWLLEKNAKGEQERLTVTLSIAFLVGIAIFLAPMIISDNIQEKKDQLLSSELEKKYEQINSQIIKGDLEKAQDELINLIHPSKEPSPFSPKGLLAEPYSYNEYWKIKREELSKKIELKFNLKK
jgi:hypothetical protein